MNEFLQNIGNDFYQAFIYDDRYIYFLNGLFNTIIIAFFSVIIGIIIGTIIILIKKYHEETSELKLLNTMCSLYISIIRGTPILLQLMIIYYIIFKTVNINPILVGIIAFGINSGAYVAEILRSGIESIDKEQKEAGYVLGLSYSQIMRYIILPQGFRNSLPTLCNEFITLLKETSVAGYIGIIELTKSSDIIASRTYNYFFPLIIVAMIYLILTLGLSFIVQKLEKRLKKC